MSTLLFVPFLYGLMKLGSLGTILSSCAIFGEKKRNKEPCTKVNNYCLLEASTLKPWHTCFGVVVWLLPKSKTSNLAALLWDHSWPFGGSQRRLSYAFSRSCWAVPFVIISALGLRVRVISRDTYIQTHTRTCQQAMPKQHGSPLWE